MTFPLSDIVTLPVAFTNMLTGTSSPKVTFSATTITAADVFPTVNAAVPLLGRYLPSPLYVTLTVLSPTVNPDTAILILPSVTPTVCSYSSPILMVTFPVAPSITVMLINATSPTVMSSTLTVTVDATLDTTIEVAFELVRYLSFSTYVTLTS